MLRRASSTFDSVLTRAAAGVLVVGMSVGAVGGSALWWRSRHMVLPLLSDTVALTPDGGRTALLPGDPRALVPGTRVLAGERGDERTRALVAQERAWLASGRVPGDGGPYGPMVRDALLDLHALTLNSGATIASMAPLWRYVWPRDAAFISVALARTGHHDDAVRVLRFVQSQQAPDGSFQARYRPDGTGPPDDRGIQEDGPGWVLWALSQVMDADPGRAQEAGAQLRHLVDRSTRRILALTADGTRLPPPSADYWEVDENTLTLGTVAPMLAGLHGAHRARQAGMQAQVPAHVPAAATSLRGLVEREFGGRGYPRHVDGDDVDAAITFVVPPVQPTSLRGAQDVWDHAVPRMQRGAGGVAPGEGWKNDGISWTPETAMLALSGAASGRTQEARRWLAWLAAHRTPAGSLPEKVLSNGDPASVAPLGWTSAAVVIAVDELGRR